MRSPKPKLSVIIPTYNRARYLKIAIDSVINQTDPGFEYEVIVVDDGSTDKTPQLLKKYGNRIKIINISHSGRPAVARNAGLAVAKGEFIAFQDSDDIWATNKLSRQLKCFTDPKIIAEYANADYIDNQGNNQNEQLVANARQGDLFLELTSKTKHPIPTNTVVVRRRALEAVGGFNEQLILGTDTECWIRLSTQGDWWFTNEVLASVRRANDNISSIPDDKNWTNSVYRHAVNQAEMFNSILASYSRLLNRAQTQRLNSRLVEIYEFISSLAHRLSLEQADKFTASFHTAPPSRLKLLAQNKRSLYAAHLLRLTKKISPAGYRYLNSWRHKLRSRR